MIISHKYQFIFLKTNKTAGTSIEIALSEFAGNKDVITPISVEDEEIRKGLGYPGPQNYLSPIWNYTPRDVLAFFRTGKKLKFYNHIHANEVLARIGNKVWNNYFKFCIERNPWDRIVSLYFHVNHSPPRIPFSEFIESKVPLILKKYGFHLYTIDGNIAVDKICRFENLSDELEVVRLKLGIPKKMSLPLAKSSFRKRKGNYRDMFGEVEKSKVAELFSEEISMFNYEF